MGRSTYVLSALIVISYLVSNVLALWDKETVCPLVCSCRLEHLTETAIYRHLQRNKKSEKQSSAPSFINNDVFYDDQIHEDNILLRTAICIFQSETNPESLLEMLPKDIEGLTLIQGYDSGNKTIKFNNLQKFSDLIMLTLKGTHSVNSNFSEFICEIDKELNVKYLDFENILLKSFNKRVELLDNELAKLTFEYVQTFERAAHPLTLIRKGGPEKIVPYSQYKEQQQTDLIPLFVGFNDLILLRISGCDLNQIHWQMFEGLRNLVYLILEKNNMRFIPDFAFYGVPNLKTLSLAWNNLLNLQITDLAGLLELENLDLSHNNFSQLSELSLPPFPKLKLANFADNPIRAIFPNTFEVMNTTESIILGSDDTLLSLLTNSFLGLEQLKKLTLKNLKVAILKREILSGIPNLKELTMSGNIPELEYDAFLEVTKLEKLIMKDCNIYNVSMDAFMGLETLRVLDLSKNQLEYLPPGVFDELSNLHELYLGNNKLRTLPKYIFTEIHPKLIRLNSNPWHCSCDMSLWKPMIVNRIKQKSMKTCDYTFDKGVGCLAQQTVIYKYIYENRVAPRCITPRKFENWSIFHAMRKGLKCTEFKPKYRKNTKPTKKNTKLKEQKANVVKHPETNSTSKIYFGGPNIQNFSSNLEIAGSQENNESKSTKITLFANDDSNDLISNIDNSFDSFNNEPNRVNNYIHSKKPLRTLYKKPNKYRKSMNNILT